jgi:CheY-like chemotaxis protein/MinD-like ATPase involved in chromosome partitioning or flagellar assembly
MAEKILIVDDDLDSLKLIGLMLQRQGYEVVAANAGMQALAKAASDHPNLIILDIMMPDMDGYEVCRRLRANAETRSIPIIMFTAKTLVDDKVAGFEAGADDYLTKPTHPAELASRVKNVLARTATQPKNKEVARGTAIGIIGVKGGVGTSTVALNLTAALHARGENPLLADFRLGAGSIGPMLGLNQITGMANVLNKPVTEIRSGLIEREVVLHQSGLRVLLSSYRSKEGQLNYTPEAASALIRTLRATGALTIYDLGSGLPPMTAKLQRDMDQIILIVEPNPVSLILARDILQEIETPSSGADRIHIVVVNRIQSTLQTPWHEIEHSLSHELLAIIPAAHDHLFTAMRAGSPVVVAQPESPITMQFLKLADDVNMRVKALTT